MNVRLSAAVCILAGFTVSRLPAGPLFETAPLTADGDLGAKMVQGIHRFLDRETVAATKARGALWKLGPVSSDGHQKVLEAKRIKLRHLLGLVDERKPPALRLPAAAPGTTSAGHLGGREPVTHVEWDTVRGVKAEGLGAGLAIAGAVRFQVIVLPDIGNSPEQMFGLLPGMPPHRQWANRFAGMAGCQVISPAFVDRRTQAAMPDGGKSTLTQREILWRAGFEMGRSLTAYDLQTVLGLVDWLKAQPGGDRQLAITGSGESGRLALLAAALDPRIAVVAVEGCIAPMEDQWAEPVDRTVFGMLREFGTAELMAMIAPRRVVWTDGVWPAVELTDHGGGAPGRLERPEISIQQAEAARAAEVSGGASADTWLTRVEGADGFMAGITAPMENLPQRPDAFPFAPATGAISAHPVDQAIRQARLFSGILEDTQVLMRQAQKQRTEYWKGADFSSAEAFTRSATAYRERFWTDITGKLPPAILAPGARSRQVYDTEKFTGWEVMLDVYPDVFAFGTLLLPKGLQPGEKRAVIVCQHGLEGRPSEVTDPQSDHWAYHAYGARLAEKGYIVFAPQNPYIGNTEFRQICRRAWPLGLSLWSVIVRQHETILNWLKTRPEVDASRMAFYGLSYGGKSAMRLPALLPDYCLSICSADYNEWIWKNVDASSRYCYLHTNEYDMVEWNMGNTFNYAELSWLIFPRPFMVERGHDDGVSCDEWVAYEFARTFRHYSRMGLPDRAEIEFFSGPHTINGKGTFRFLDKWLAK